MNENAETEVPFVVDPTLPVVEDVPGIQPELDADGNVIVHTIPAEVEEVPVNG